MASCIENIRLSVAITPRPPAEAVEELTRKEGAIEVYCWFEGPKRLPKPGADWMVQKLFVPTYRRKPEVKFWLYSLDAWSWDAPLSGMGEVTTPLGRMINGVNRAALETFSSAEFFRFCQEEVGSAVYRYIQEELPKKRGLFALSEKYKPRGKSVDWVFEGKPSLFDCLKERDIAHAYSAMQYIEGYYLIQKRVREALEKRQVFTQLAFLLPNDESKYYLSEGGEKETEREMSTLLNLAFGKQLSELEISISFIFFQYTKNLEKRPYYGSGKALETQEDVDLCFAELKEKI